MDNLIGRKREVRRLEKCYSAKKSSFVAVYGRRRVGKTFLIREVFKNKFSFHMTGMANVDMKQQLSQFHAEMVRYSPEDAEIKPAKDWFTAFRQIIQLLEQQDCNNNKVIFLDELPWLATRGSKFLSALEHFWNSWASARKDIMLIVCGSAASWMINNLLNNKGGLHNRVTDRIRLDPFNLAETEQLLISNNAVYDRYQIVLLYMVFGGIPFYLEQIDTGLSAIQNINELCFSRGAIFREEYDNLYTSLFNKAERHIAIIEALATKNKGLSRQALIDQSKLPDGGSLNRLLKELQESSFTRRYRSFGKRERDSLYQLVDLYSLFYLNFIEKSDPDDENFWINAMQSPLFRAWSGYAFEMVCLHHVGQIKKALGISGVQSSVSGWMSNKAQIDLLIDRKDQVVNLCEMKFSLHPFSINKKYAENIRNKVGSFKEVTKTKKAIFFTMITTYGVADNRYAAMIQNNLTMDILFEET